MATIIKKKKKLSDYIIEELKGMIDSGELKEGDKLPNQNEFAAQLGISRSSLREALHTLTLSGVVEQRPGMGTVIRSGKPLLWAEHLSPPLISDSKATLELVEARRYLEVGVARLAVQNATKGEIKQMGHQVRKMSSLLKENRFKEYLELDVAFHYHIASSSHNRYMLNMLVTIRGLMEQFMHEAYNILPDQLHRSMRFHSKIYEGMKEGNERKVIANMESHIRDIELNLKTYYKSSQNAE